jgi:hypothetical protein
MSNHKRKVSLGEFRRLLVDEIKRLLLQAKRAKEIESGGGFVRRDPTLVIRYSTTNEVVEEIYALGTTITTEIPVLTAVVKASNDLAQASLSSPKGPELVDVYNRLMKLHNISSDSKAMEDNFELRATADAVFFEFKGIGDDPDGTPSWALNDDQEDQNFLAATANVIAHSRRENKKFTRDEQVAIAWSYRLLDRGVQMPPGYLGIGVYGFRKHQTNLSLANPGEGHVSVTCASSDLLRGTFVHIEHIDRENLNREIVEPYRLPATVNAARVRLHCGAAAPCTAFIGRPVFENGVETRSGTEILMPKEFEFDLLKTVHLTASAATGMFMNGVADCKIAIERMSVTQAITFMRSVSGNVVRDPCRQYLSAAFNINLPVWDDRGETPRLVTDRFEIGQLAIDVTVAGRFDKVTWDGATNVSPSIPIISQLTIAQWVELVHIAHERGLETYISAGLKPPQMRECTFLGVDGVGIGTSLHYQHPVTKAIGQLKAEAVREVRDAAAKEPLGRGARLLARLDRLFFEGTLPAGLDPKRAELFLALRAEQEKEVRSLVDTIGNLDEYSGSEHPVIEQAKRMIKTVDLNPIGEVRYGKAAWQQRVDVVNDRLMSHDIAGLEEAIL